MKKLNVAIIGQGRSGRDIHGTYFLSDVSKDRFNVVAVCDWIPERRERAKKEFGCDVYEDYKMLFGREDIDIVVNCTFSYEHFPVTMDLLSHGFNVVCEKPFSAHAFECEQMINKAKENNVMLTVFQQSRFAPYYTQIRRIMDSGILGTIKQVNIHFSGFSRRWDWQTSNRFYGGSLLNTGPHPMDQALDILNTDDMPNVLCKMDKVNTFGDAEDYVKVILTYPNRPLIDVEISSCDAFSDYTYKVQGSNGGLRATMSRIDYKYFKPEEAPEQKLILTPLMNSEFKPIYCGESLKWYTESENVEGTAFDSAVDAYYNNVYNHLLKGEELVIKPEKIVQQIRVAELCHAQNPMPTIF